MVARLAVRTTTGKDAKTGCYRPKNFHRISDDYSKTDVSDLAQKCMSPTTNALDIDFHAYSTLFPGKTYTSGNPEVRVTFIIRAK